MKLYLDIFKEIEKLKGKTLKLIDGIEKVEKEREALYKMLIAKEEECLKLQNERDHFAAACKIKDTIIRKGSLL
jgi:hypothetical protein